MSSVKFTFFLRNNAIKSHVLVTYIFWNSLVNASFDPNNASWFEDLLKSEQQASTIVDAINDVSWLKHNLEFLQDLWHEEEAKYPDLLWNQLKNDSVKLALGSVLGQAYRQCKIQLDIDNIHEFFLLKIKDDNILIRNQAIFNLGYLRYEEDIPLLVSLIRNSHLNAAENAIMSLVFMNKNSALEALKELSMNLKRDSLKYNINTVLESYKSYKLSYEECHSID